MANIGFLFHKACRYYHRKNNGLMKPDTDEQLWDTASQNYRDLMKETAQVFLDSLSDEDIREVAPCPVIDNPPPQPQPDWAIAARVLTDQITKVRKLREEIDRDTNFQVRMGDTFTTTETITFDQRLNTNEVFEGLDYTNIE